MKPRALDLFCGAGGASKGLADAGFEVFGVDLHPQPSYPFKLIQGDALSLCSAWVANFDFVWSSPPCQHSTAYNRRPNHVNSVANLIPETRALLKGAGRPFVIENVPGARAHLVDPVMLCGSMFHGLDVQRHRYFECSFPVPQPKCDHSKWEPRFPPATNRKNKRKTVEVGVWRIPLETQRQAMGIDWMHLKDLSQAIPPAYSEHIGRAALEAIS